MHWSTPPGTLPAGTCCCCCKAACSALSFDCPASCQSWLRFLLLNPQHLLRHGCRSTDLPGLLRLSVSVGATCMHAYPFALLLPSRCHCGTLPPPWLAPPLPVHYAAFHTIWFGCARVVSHRVIVAPPALGNLAFEPATTGVRVCAYVCITSEAQTAGGGLVLVW